MAEVAVDSHSAEVREHPRLVNIPGHDGENVQLTSSFDKNQKSEGKNVRHNKNVNKKMILPNLQH